MDHDAFISHASEDKRTFVRPLADMLAKMGMRVWYDEKLLQVGDSLSESIDAGLARSRFGIVVLSRAFLEKPWPRHELRGLVQKEINGTKTILPIWFGITQRDLMPISPTLADKVALRFPETPLLNLAFQLLQVIRPDIVAHMQRIAAHQRLLAGATRKDVPFRELKVGPIRHRTLSDAMLARIRLINRVFADIIPQDEKKAIENFKRDADPERELRLWETMAAAFLKLTSARRLTITRRRAIVGDLLRLSMSSPSEFAAALNSSNQDLRRSAVAYLEAAGPERKRPKK
jgi:hypothetical protein